MPLLMRPKLNRQRWKKSLRAVQKQRKEVDTDTWIDNVTNIMGLFFSKNPKNICLKNL